MYYTDNYTVLKNNGDGEDITILPNTPFEAFEGDYLITSFARIKSKETDEIVTELMAGENTKGVGVVTKPTRARVRSK